MLGVLEWFFRSFGALFRHDQSFPLLLHEFMPLLTVNPSQSSLLFSADHRRREGGVYGVSNGVYKVYCYFKG